MVDETPTPEIPQAPAQPLVNPILAGRLRRAKYIVDILDKNKKPEPKDSQAACAVTDLKYPLDNYLTSNLDEIPKFLKKGWDCVIIVSGNAKVRIGKSTLAMQMAYYVAWLLNEKNKKKPIRQKVEKRMALNMPLQGLAADILKTSMSFIDKFIVEKKLSGDARMILTIHDELIFEIKDDLLKKGRESEIIKNIESIMEKSFKLNVPIETRIGKKWGEMEQIYE